MTNYEKIKSMSVDEMAKFLDHTFVLDCGVCPRRKNCATFIPANCSKALKDWLKAESEED